MARYVAGDGQFAAFDDHLTGRIPPSDDPRNRSVLRGLAFFPTVIQHDERIRDQRDCAVTSFGGTDDGDQL